MFQELQGVLPAIDGGEVGRLLTVGVLAEVLDVPAHRVEYVLKTRDIQPAGRAGNLRVFDAAAVDRLRRELDQHRQTETR